MLLLVVSKTAIGCSVLYNICREYYEEGAILLQEDATILQGLMVGLNCIDCHLSIKDNTHLDDPVSPFIYMFTYLACSFTFILIFRCGFRDVVIAESLCTAVEPGDK